MATGELVSSLTDTQLGAIKDKGYLIVASSQQLTLANANELNTEPTTPPDEISDEPENLGIYEGIDVLTEFLTYLPVTLRNSH